MATQSCISRFINLKDGKGPGESVQLLREVVALAGDCGLVPRTYMASHNYS